MPGQIKALIDTIIKRRSKGNRSIEMIAETKFILKGVDPNRFDATSADDPSVIARVKAIAEEMGVSV